MDGTSKAIQVTCHHRIFWFPGSSLAFSYCGYLSKHIASLYVMYSFPLKVPLGREEKSRNRALRAELQSRVSISPVKRAF